MPNIDRLRTHPVKQGFRITPDSTRVHVPPREKPPGDSWVEGYITLSILVRESRRVQADILGPFAVHEPVEGNLKTDKGKWAVTSVTTGQLITIVSDKTDALKIAKILHGNFLDIFNLKTVADIKAAIPGWVHPWVTACRLQGKYVNHLIYMRTK